MMIAKTKLLVCVSRDNRKKVVARKISHNRLKANSLQKLILNQKHHRLNLQMIQMPTRLLTSTLMSIRTNSKQFQKKRSRKQYQVKSRLEQLKNPRLGRHILAYHHRQNLKNQKKLSKSRQRNKKMKRN